MGCSSALRGALLAEAVLVFAGGLLLLVVGADALVSDGSRAAVLAGVLLARGAAWLLVTAGLLLMLLATLGGMGAALRHRGLTIAFCVLSGLLLVVTLLAAVTAMVMTGPASDQLETALFRSMAEYGEDGAVTNGWDLLQSGFHCCGVIDGDDWRRNGSLPAAVPWSCCRRFANGTVMACEEQPDGADSFFSTGCLSAARQLLTTEGWLIGGTTIGLTALLIASIVAGCCFIRTRK
ncbi:Tetraspanin-11 [Amphibalanus amphitrite]|uniref:Tetraspanin n=1 Tax=Amphibalanus amphitrite TaxID=1232801 RepID=A0A6A4WTL7_AMPAM|nr:Tetraspanin-11 [Amphibalanus amphitrite]